MGDPVRFFCVHHPSARARRKCFHCLSPICPACQVRALGHIFCSDRCRRKYRCGEMAQRLGELSLRLWLRGRRVEKALSRWTGGGLVRGVSLALLLFLLYQTILLTRTVREFPSLPVEESVSLAPPTLDLVRDGRFVTVSGSAERFSMAVLVADGRERDFCPIREGRFSFTFEPEEQERSLQVQVYGDNLPVLYSRACPIEPPAAPKAASVAPAPGARPQSVQAVPPETAQARTAAPVSSRPSAAPVHAPLPAAAGTAALAADMNRGDPGRRMVAITFDGGSQGNSAEKILDVLAERRIKATFFLTGEFMERFGQITKRIAREGHEVGNHMFSHPHLTTFGKNLRQETLPGTTRELVTRELGKNEELFTRLTGARMVPLWRAPYGEQNEIIRRWAAEAGYRHVSWTYDPKTRRSLDGLDWVSDRTSALYLTSDQIVQKILSFDRDTEMGLSGGIVLLHLGSERDADPFHAKFEKLLDALEKKGYRVGSISEMLSDAGGGQG